MAIKHKTTFLPFLFMVFVLMLLAGCGSSSSPDPPAPVPAPLNATNVNLIFVVSEDVAYHAPGDINPLTANLTSQGLQRSLLMATFLKQQVLGTKNVTGIYALDPMTHLQTPNQVSRYGGAGDHPAVCAAQPGHICPATWRRKSL